MTESISRAQIDRLGERLRENSASEEDLILLARYRQSFEAAHRRMDTALKSLLQERFDVTPVGRLKTNDSIIDKLKRESIRLSQMQDIAGWRIVLPDILTQNTTLEILTSSFSSGGSFGDNFAKLRHVFDRRKSPSHGYRAVHLIVEADGKQVEIQVRSFLQDVWAVYSEILADNLGIGVKYGVGDAGARESLSVLSSILQDCENLKVEAAEWEVRIQQQPSSFSDKDLQDFEHLKKLLDETTTSLTIEFMRRLGTGKQ